MIEFKKYSSIENSFNREFLEYGKPSVKYVYSQVSPNLHQVCSTWKNLMQIETILFELVLI